MSEYRLVNTPEAAQWLHDYVTQFPEQIGFDTETTGTRRWHDTVVGFSIAPRWGEAYYIPVAHEQGNLDHAIARELLADILRTKPVVCHGASFDTVMAARWVGISAFEIEVAHCTMILAQTLGERSEAGKDTSAGLKNLAKKYLGIERSTFADLFPPKTKNKDKDFRKVDLDVAVPYAAADADDVLGLVTVLEPLLDKAGVRATYELEVTGRANMPTTEQELWDLQANPHGSEGNVLHEILWMEDRGVMIDPGYAETMAEQCRAYSEKADGVILERLSERLGRPLTNPIKEGEPFNLASPDQLRVILFQPPPLGLGLPVIKKTPPSKKAPEGNASTDESVLEKLAVHEPALLWLLEKRAADKAVGTYFEPMAKEHAIEEDGQLIVHPNYKTNGTETGRMAGDDPNMQNQPKEDVIGEYASGPYKGHQMIPGCEPITVNARNMVVPRPGFYILEMDWDQVEYRAIGGLSGDPGLLEVFATGIDLHSQTYALMNGVPIESVDKGNRQDGKTMNYALNFGAGANRVAGMIGCTPQEAKEKIARYKAAYPLVALWKEQTEEFAQRHGFVQTLFGRKRWLTFGGSGISEDAARKARFAALREAVNMPVQGVCADMLKVTLVRLGPWLRTYFPTVRTILTTHDSITFEVPLDIDPRYLSEALRPVVEFPAGFIAGWPAITASFSWGSRWGALEEDKNAGEVAAAVNPVDSAVAPAGPSAVASPVPITVDLNVQEQMTPEQGAALAELLGGLGGINTLALTIPNDGGASIEIPNVNVGPNDGHLFAHIFTTYTLTSRAEVLGNLVPA